jgi:1-deoxy-D-xylulose-5-phosphate synthase
LSKEILGRMNSPKDLKKLSLSELDTLCEEIREKIIDTVSRNGGHLASNLGVVELTVALHRVFNCPEDYIVWDVGHQCYAHKILTGRLDKLNTIRQENGISGFPRRNESAYDTFSTGHSSTSISSAYGIARAKNILEEDAKVVAIIGDGALSGGLAYEGLNNAGSYRKNFIVILNDNKMSISRNVGSMARYLSTYHT